MSTMNEYNGARKISRLCFAWQSVHTPRAGCRGSESNGLHRADASLALYQGVGGASARENARPDRRAEAVLGQR